MGDQMKKTLYGILGGFLLFICFVLFTSDNTGNVEIINKSQPLMQYKGQEFSQSHLPQNELTNIAVPNPEEINNHVADLDAIHQKPEIASSSDQFVSKLSNGAVTDRQTESRTSSERKIIPNAEGNLGSNKTTLAAPFANVPLDLKKFDPKLFREFPTKFDSKYKSPCWQEGGKLHCLPYFYQIGLPKCGTTDLWDKIIQHPQVKSVPKEPHWWARRRLGWKDVPIHPGQVKKIRRKTGTGDDRPFRWYINWFDEFAVPSVRKNPQLIFGDGSVTTSFYISNQWKDLFPEAKEPPYVLADLMHALQPKAKIVAIVREPVSRMYAAFLYNRGRTSTGFNKKAKHHISCMEKCFERSTVRNCVYTGSCDQLFRGMYYIYIKDWIEAYGAEQVHVIRLEDWISSPVVEFNKLTQFLGLETLSDSAIETIFKRNPKNSQSRRKEKAGNILPETERLLRDFYRPFNQKLAELLNDTRFLWGY